MNRDRKQPKARQPNPMSNASILSRLTFWWLKPMIKLGLSREIQEDDIYAVTNSMRSEENTHNFVKHWKIELEKSNPSIFRVMLKIYGYKVFMLSFFYSIGLTLARLIQPVCLGGFVGYFAQTDDIQITLNDAYWYASGIVLSSAYSMVSFHPFILYLFKTSCKLRVACSGLVYRKALRLTKSATEEGQNGKIINLLSDDLVKIQDGLPFLFDLWEGPLEAFAFFIVIYMEIGTAAIVGIAFLASFIPLQGWIGRRSAQLRTKKATRTDFRIKIMNEILLGIQVIKMYAWENSFAKMVDQIRKKEVNTIRSIAHIRATINSFKMISKLSIFLSLVSYVYFGNVITARKVFIVSSYFNTLNLTMVYLWPYALTQVAETYISIKRLQTFLLRPESKHPKARSKKQIIKNDKQFDKIESDKIKLLADEMSFKRIQNINIVEKFIRLENVTAVWKRNENHQMNGLFGLNVHISPELCAIVGPVGSGKSTLLNVILGELELDMGSITVNGSISYASQEPWLFEGSVRNNIVFVEEFNEQRYKQVIEVCALERDFQLLPQGDETIVGEQGSSLSGGQKARVNLARAIYKQSDIYLLDDPLSAVDTNVGKHIFEKCINGFLAGKLCILVTHQLQYLKNVDHVILMNNGKIEAQGAFRTLQRFNKESLMYAQEDTEQNIDGGIPNRMPKNKSAISFSAEKIADDTDSCKELQASGSVKMTTYKAFFHAAHSNILVIVVLAVFIVSQFAWTGADYFLSEWVDWEENLIKTHSENPTTTTATSLNSTNNAFITNSTASAMVVEEREKFLIVYACIMVLGTFCYLSRSFSFYRMSFRISINLHDMLFRGVTRAKMIFFNNNQSGRILNRFARDINSIDSLLPNMMVDVFDCLLQYLAIIVINVAVNPWLLIPSTAMTFVFYLLRIVYMNVGRRVKRIEATSRSPIFSHVNATLQGLATVRASNAAFILEKEFHEFTDYNTSCWYVFMCAARWFALWLDFVCILFIAIVTFSFLSLGNAMDLQSGRVGLAILSSINLLAICQWGMRMSAELESQMTSVERIMEYAELPSEPPLTSNEPNAPPTDWPSYGNIELKALSLRYSENSGRILRNFTFRINAQQKIGVVGRTGAGKSSLIQSLFRLAENEGQILIDDVDVGSIGLHDLRKKISIIPQEAVLFSGSLRFNLDPFDERTDNELWNSLEQVELKAVVSALSGGLDSKVLDGGSNFSVGQRQLLCLARAILRNNKILILDEATANVDSETDRLIQQTIRRNFADCTVITIAHRLHTVMDSDKVLVVDAGEIVEFDHPFELINKSGGFFKHLIDQTGSPTAIALTLIAKKNYEKGNPVISQ